MENQLSQQTALPRIAGNNNTFFLKIIAILCMLVDHTAVVFFNGAAEMRLIGRIAFPLFAWCLVVGAEYTRSKRRYALWLLIVGIISQPCYMLGLNHKWHELNIFATLLLGLLAISGIRERKYYSHIWVPVICLLLPCMIKMDYGWEGVLLILCLHAARKQKGALAAVMICFCLYWGQGTYTVFRLFGMKIPTYSSFLPHASKLISSITRIQFGAILSLPLMLIPMRYSFRLPKWLSYCIYPAHLLILGIIRHWEQITFFIKGFFQSF